MTREYETVTGTVTEVRRLQNSLNGNARVRFVVDTGSDPYRLRPLRTRTDSSLANDAKSLSVGDWVTVTLDGRGSPTDIVRHGTEPVSESSDQTVCGYTNWETFTICLMLSNERTLYYWAVEYATRYPVRMMSDAALALNLRDNLRACYTDGRSYGFDPHLTPDHQQIMRCHLPTMTPFNWDSVNWSEVAEQVRDNATNENGE